jgi:hypothetical protein
MMSSFNKLNSTYINSLQRLYCGFEANVESLHPAMQYRTLQIVHLIGGQGGLGSGLAAADQNDV